MDNKMTLISPVGRFEFDKTTPLSHAKLIRDSVVGQILNPKDGRRLRNSNDIYKFIWDMKGSLAMVPFRWYVV